MTGPNTCTEWVQANRNGIGTAKITVNREKTNVGVILCSHHYYYYHYYYYFKHEIWIAQMDFSHYYIDIYTLTNSFGVVPAMGNGRKYPVTFLRLCRKRTSSWTLWCHALSRWEPELDSVSTHFMSIFIKWVLLMGTIITIKYHKSYKWWFNDGDLMIVFLFNGMLPSGNFLAIEAMAHRNRWFTP